MAAKPKAGWWIWNISIWLGIGLLDATQTVFVMRSEGMHHAWTELFFTLLISRLPWALATPIILRLGRSYSPAQFTRLKTWAVHLTACFSIAAVSSAWMAALEKLLNPWAYSNNAGPFLEIWKERFNNSLLEAAFLYAAVLATNQILVFPRPIAA